MNELDKTMNEMFDEAQAELPEEKRAANIGEPMCPEIHDGYRCTRPVHDSGKHVAHGRLGDIIKEWE